MERAQRRLESMRNHLLPHPQASAGGIAPEATSAGGADGESIWQEVPQAPPDAILGISEAFKADTNPRKLNLGVGAYRTEAGKPLVLNVVRKAEEALVRDTSRNKEYSPIGGNPDFCRLSARLAFGEHSAVLREKRNATVQSLSGTGSLRARTHQISKMVGAEFLHSHSPGAAIYLPKPTWANHLKLFPAAGMDVRAYRYYLPSTRGLDLNGMLEDLNAAPEGSIVLLHACAHNPTGVDPTLDEWRRVLDVVQRRHLLPFFDMAYQGFASGSLDSDAAALRMFADAGLELLLAQSFAKNMGLYGERVGALTVVTRQAAVTKRVESQLKQVIRAMYSSPPGHGAAIATAVLSDQALFREWEQELKGMAGRIKEMRTGLHDALTKAGAPGEWTHVLKQIGMFSYTGLTPKQVEVLTSKWHVYLTKDGRISMAGLSTSSCDYLAQAIADAVRSG